MEKEKIVEINNEEIQETETQEKKKLFTKKTLKKIGIIVGGAVVTAVMIFIGVAANGSSNETSEDSEMEPDDIVANPEEISEEATETSEE